MQFGYDENKIRTKPSFSGQRAICPLCGGTLIGKCGDIYVRHWQHHHDRECDPWKEHETDWHRKWKANFPENWQEVIIEKNGEKHIADIRTANGIVIEFQNSSISTSTIRIREDFYENMIWVVNAKPFKDNFIIRSLVNAQIKNIEANAFDELSSVKAEYEEELKNIQNSLDKNKKDSTEKLNDINYKKGFLETLNQTLKEFDTFSDTVIKKWSQDEYYWDFNNVGITNKIESDIKNQLKEITKEICELQFEISSKDLALNNIEQLENFVINERIFKIVNYEHINSKNYYRTKAISKISRRTFFPEIITFMSETEFLSYQFKQKQFDFAIDPTETINLLNKKIDESRRCISALEESLLSVKEKIKENLFRELKNKIQDVENEIVQSDNEWDELIKQNSFLVEKEARVEAEKEAEVSTSTIEIEMKKKEQRSKIMKEKKGLYTFAWKHERKSWRVAENKLFFDIGEDYLFERVGYDTFKKIITSEFLAHLIGTNVNEFSSIGRYNRS